MAWRILLFALLLNVITLGSVQVFVHFSQEQWLQNRRADSDESVRIAAAKRESLAMIRIGVSRSEGEGHAA